MNQKEQQKQLACKNGIENMLGERFDGFYLSGNCAEDLCRMYGAEMVGCVLAATILAHPYDTRFRPHNRKWAEQTLLASQKPCCTVSSHPELVNGLTDQYRRFLLQSIQPVTPVPTEADEPDMML